MDGFEVIVLIILPIVVIALGVYGWREAQRGD